ncbi:putative membrane protein [Propionispora sp. 2/2-37]|uniref:preprotein translocase subunit SecE n=1 Tax=Propionispora sp. 2/2-37 TaxID=1677858 RepID=UPI0006BB66A2|nr:preprotein translocase subunit SecE [Propionispora sp. 2/2-37]CUH97834.1 putative membrane protein [Propionispora sp. 2/2-37]
MAAQETAVQGSASRSRRFLREVKAELKKVSWPSKQELISYTGIVFVAVVFVAVLIWGIDTVYTKLLHVFINK